MAREHTTLSDYRVHQHDFWCLYKAGSRKQKDLFERIRDYHSEMRHCDWLYSKNNLARCTPNKILLELPLHLEGFFVLPTRKSLVCVNSIQRLV